MLLCNLKSIAKKSSWRLQWRCRDNIDNTTTGFGVVIVAVRKRSQMDCRCHDNIDNIDNGLANVTLGLRNDSVTVTRRDSIAP